MAASVPDGEATYWLMLVFSAVTLSGAVPVFFRVKVWAGEVVFTRTAPKARLAGEAAISGSGVTGVKLVKPRVAIEASVVLSVPSAVALVPATLKSVTSRSLMAPAAR